MKILVVSQDASAIRTLSSTLGRDNHTIDVARDAESAQLKIADHRPDCVIADWLMPGVDGVELTRRIRAQHGGTIQIAVMCELADAAARAHVVRAGADLYLVKPLYAQQLLGAIQTLRNALRVVVASSAHDVLQQRLMKHAVWTSHDRFVGECLQGCTGLTLRKSTSSLALAAPTDVSASLGMIDAATHAEVHYSIRVDRTSAAALAKAMLGSSAVDDEALLDLVGELCNNLLGQSKTMLRSDGFEFALAVPGVDKPRVLPQDVVASKAAVLVWGNSSMLVSVGLRSSQPGLVRARELSEHMVLLEDVRTPQGALLAPSGTRLTAVTAERLMRHLPNHEFRIATVGK
jgi:CheY-like chemotaxis protein/CheY-specific phosphatase CheX